MECHEPGSKRHAVRGDDLDSPLYWAGNNEDWHEVRRRPRIPLECMERCGVELVSVEDLSHQYIPRSFPTKAPVPHCDHWKLRGGGKEPQHNWLKNTITAIAPGLGYRAVVEHWPPRADVYVGSSAPFCIEIQLGPTPFDARTRVRGRPAHTRAREKRCSG